MVCTKCQIKNYAIQSAHKNNISADRANLIARIVFEELQANESFSKAPTGEGGDFKACVSKMMKDGKSEESAKKICASIGRKKFGKKKFQKLAAGGRKESYTKNENKLMKKINNNEPVSPEEALAQYEMAFKDVLDIKMNPIKNLEEIEQLREQLWKAEDRMYDSKWAYMKVALGNEDEKESKLLNIRLGIREKYNGTNKEAMVQNEVGKVHETDTSTRERQFNPSECEEGTFRTITLGKGKKGVICKKKGADSTSLQTIITPKAKKKETMQENEDILGSMQGKSRQEKLEILEESYPDIDKDILEDMVD